MLRSVLIFPELDNMQRIDTLRKQYDPLAEKVRPHITLVFPFESELNADDIEKELQKVLQAFTPFRVRLQGLMVSGRWLFLNVAEGVVWIKKIQEALYANLLAPYKPHFSQGYTPHLTVGRLPTVTKAQKIYEKEKTFLDEFSTQINKITVERIDEEENSIIELEIDL